jgi:hypothetical protein
VWKRRLKEKDPADENLPGLSLFRAERDFASALFRSMDLMGHRRATKRLARL